MNSNTSPLSDESQLTSTFEEAWLARRRRTWANSAGMGEPPIDWSLAFKPTFKEGWDAAIEAEVRSLRSQGEPVYLQFRTKGDGWETEYICDPNFPVGNPALEYRSLYASPPSQPIASDVVAAPDALSRHGSVEAESHQSPRNTGGWISVEARLPPVRERVIFWRPEGFSFGSRCDDMSSVWEDESYQNGDGESVRCWGVTHWMPLPRAPQSDFRGLETGEGPQGHAATSPDVLSRQSPAEADTQRSYRQPEARLRNALGELFGIGSASRHDDVILTNASNAMRRAHMLSAIEREFFTKTVKDDDGEDWEECSLNSWGSTEAEYIEQFRAALVAASPSDTSQGVSEAEDGSLIQMAQEYSKRLHQGTYELPTRVADELSGVLDALCAALRGEPPK